MRKRRGHTDTQRLPAFPPAAVGAPAPPAPGLRAPLALPPSGCQCGATNLRKPANGSSGGGGGGGGAAAAAVGFDVQSLACKSIAGW